MPCLRKLLLNWRFVDPSLPKVFRPKEPTRKTVIWLNANTRSEASQTVVYTKSRCGIWRFLIVAVQARLSRAFSSGLLRTSFFVGSLILGIAVGLYRLNSVAAFLGVGLP
jgi:hypothetical protein